MSATLAFVEHLIRHGEAVFHQKPEFAREDRAGLLNLLEGAYAQYGLDIAGPLLPFDGESAIAAVRFVALACWALVSDDAPDAIKKTLRFTPEPTTPEAHLSADLTLRYLPTVHRRVRTRTPDDPLHRAVVDVLRRWPLSGALAEIDDPPLSELHFHNHFGLQLLYAERLAAHWRPSWVPPEGRGREVVELVLQQQGKTLPAIRERPSGE